ncbi:histidine kinase [Arthrospiribacter ruber]|uniref:Histidine kinase n=2 Tax=Arthrospiribacter ruber TaxID=2487934 RepID=A0A951MFN4_9BACT|nr:histidine kinase [Arthrospiribacter ruber]
MSLFALHLYRKSQSLIKEREILDQELSRLTEKVNTKDLAIIDYQLNPHLFKNILNSIQSHAYQTYFALDKMSGVLDFILYQSKNKFVTAREEIQFAKDLIEINKIKLSPLFELKVKTKIGPNEPMFDQKLIAPLITIDLIENAFKHADLQKGDSFIHVTFQFHDGFFILTVSNSISAKPPLEKLSGGLGITSMEQRLEILYKDCYKFDKFVEDEVYISHLTLDLFSLKSKILSKGKI